MIYENTGGIPPPKWKRKVVNMARYLRTAKWSHVRLLVLTILAMLLTAAALQAFPCVCIARCNANYNGCEYQCNGNAKCDEGCISKWSTCIANCTGQCNPI